MSLLADTLLANLMFVSSFFFWCNLAGTLPENTNPKQTVPQQVMQARGAPLANLIAYLMMLHEESRFEGWVFFRWDGPLLRSPVECGKGLFCLSLFLVPKGLKKIRAEWFKNFIYLLVDSFVFSDLQCVSSSPHSQADFSSPGLLHLPRTVPWKNPTWQALKAGEAALQKARVSWQQKSFLFGGVWLVGFWFDDDLLVHYFLCVQFVCVAVSSRFFSGVGIGERFGFQR